MKNELGIEVCCKNCMYYKPQCAMKLENYCRKYNKIEFRPRRLVYEARIKELQEQQFTEKELQFIKNRLNEIIEEWNVPEIVFMAHKILKKIEQTLKTQKEI